MDELRVERSGAVATVVINRPEQHNAINYAMWGEIPALCAALERDPAVRVVVWRGAGDDAFSAGGDIAEFAWQRSNRAQAEAYNARVDAALACIAALEKPAIAAVKGYCIGGGLMLACHCDLRLAAGNARFAIPVARLGAVITYAEMRRFLDVMGSNVLTDLLLTGHTLDAVEAHVVGLCNQVYPLELLDRAVADTAERIAGLAPLAQRTHKQMLRALARTPDPAALSAADLDLPAAVFDSADYREGTQAFLDKRTPRFGEDRPGGA